MEPKILVIEDYIVTFDFKKRVISFSKKYNEAVGINDKFDLHGVQENEEYIKYYEIFCLYADKELGLLTKEKENELIELIQKMDII